MKFYGNPSAQLGLDYHAFGEVENQDGSITLRFVLSNTPTEEQEELISKYENLKLVKDGAKYRYAPEQRYAVLYQNLPVGYEDEEESDVAVEEFVEDDEYLAISELDKELGLDPEESLSRFAKITSAINMANNLALYYKQLQVEDEDYSDIYERMSKEVIDQVNKLQGLVNFNEELDHTHIEKD